MCSSDLPAQDRTSDEPTRKIQQQVSEIDPRDAGQHTRNEADFAHGNQCSGGDARKILTQKGCSGDEKQLRQAARARIR